MTIIVPTHPLFVSHYGNAERMLTAAVNEADAEKRRTLAMMGQAYATLAQVDATWLRGPITS